MMVPGIDSALKEAPSLVLKAISTCEDYHKALSAFKVSVMLCYVTPQHLREFPNAFRLLVG